MISKNAQEAAELINRLDRLSRSDGAQSGLNPAQWEALRYIARANRFSRSPAALAAYLGSTRGTVSQTLITLEQKGLVARTPSARDGRVIELGLTPEGQAMVADDPLNGLAADLTAGASDLPQLVAALRATLRETIRRNGGRAFKACETCRHFERGQGGPTPHRCNLLNAPLSDADGRAICMEHTEGDVV
jgi:DNA-binding MarR family transcriptional regulator